MRKRIRTNVADKQKNSKDRFKSLNIFGSYMRSPYPSKKHISYFQVYSDLLEPYRNKPITFVEIGVLDGGSLFMWRDYLGPKARIIGVEFNPGAKIWEEHGFEVFIGSQSNPVFWKNFFKKIGKVDIVLDDGGHTNEQQIVTALSCIPQIKDKGILIVEDIHTSFMTRFGNPSKYSFIQYAKAVATNINKRFPGIQIQNSLLNKFVYSVSFFESIIAFKIDRKKCFENIAIDNGKLPVGGKKAVDFRHKGTLLDIVRMKSRWISWAYMKLKNFKLRKYFYM